MTQAILKGIPVSEDEWHLYRIPGVDNAAVQIAQTLSDAIRANFTAEIALDTAARDAARNEVFKSLRAVLDELSDFGATDGEPYSVASRIINKAFPLEDKFNW